MNLITDYLYFFVNVCIIPLSPPLILPSPARVRHVRGERLLREVPCGQDGVPEAAVPAADALLRRLREDLHHGEARTGTGGGRRRKGRYLFSLTSVTTVFIHACFS